MTTSAKASPPYGAVDADRIEDDLDTVREFFASGKALDLWLSEWSGNTGVVQRVLSAALAGQAANQPVAVTIDMVRALPAVNAPEFDGEESDGTPRRWDRRRYVSRTKLEALLRERGALPWTLPKEPPPGLLMSMAVRYDHGLAVPGHYDQLTHVLHGGASHAQRLDGTLRTMRQLYEEVAGFGFYRPEHEATYAAAAKAGLAPATKGDGDAAG